MVLAETVAVLTRTPGTLRALLAELPEPWLDVNEGPDTFSPRDVVGHLIHGEETDWVPRVKLILEAGDTRPFVPFDRVGFDALRGAPITELLDAFAGHRAANLTILEGLALTPADLARPGRHPHLGPVTLGQLLSTWAVHDLNHIGQIVRVMSRRYAQEVGPWNAKGYLGILNPAS